MFIHSDQNVFLFLSRHLTLFLVVIINYPLSVVNEEKYNLKPKTVPLFSNF